MLGVVIHGRLIVILFHGFSYCNTNLSETRASREDTV